jgi:hypothetical protein
MVAVWEFLATLGYFTGLQYQPMARFEESSKVEYSPRPACDVNEENCYVY